MATVLEHDAIHQMIADSPPWYKVPSLIRLYFLLIAPLLTSTAWGFDLSMTNGLQSVSTFMDNFGNPTGATLGFFGASMSVGGIVACIVGGPLNDRFGRRALCSAGAAIVAGMAIMQTFSTNFHMFAGAKLLLGFGSNLQQVAAPVLVTELAHPKQRVAISSLYNTSIYIGLIIGAWITFGTYNMNSQWAWKLPCILQVMLPGYQVLMVWLCPESPRWLISKGRIEEARSILIKYHGSGIETDLVKHEMQEIIAGIEADKTQFDLNWNSFKSIIGTKGNRHRLWIGVMTAVGSQSLGGSFVAVYLPQILDQIGYTSSKEKTLINGIMSICNWVTSFVAALIIPYVGRRTIFLTSTTGMTVTFIIWTAFTAQYSVDARKSYGLVVLAMIFIYNVFTTICWIPLVIAYPLETVTTKQRGIFFALTMLCINTAAFVSSYINPIGLDAIGWRYYIPQCVFNTLFIFIIYFTFVETKGLTLEEIAVLFDGEESFQDGAVADALAIEKAKHKDQDFSHVEEIIDSKV